MNIYKIIGRTYPAFSSPPCNGIFSWIGDIVGDITGSNKQNNKNISLQQDTNEQQKQMFYDQLKWQEEQNAITRQFNAQEADWAAWRDQQFSREMFNAENEYNSAASQFKRFQEAGLNPSVAFSNSQTSAGMASANGVSSSPASTSPTSSPSPPSLTSPQATITTQQDLATIAQIVNLAAGAKKLFAEGSEINTLLPKKVENMIADTFQKEASSRLQKITAEIQEKFGKKAAEASIGKDLSEAAKNIMQGGESFANIRFTNTRAFLNKLLGERYGIENKSWAQKVQNDLDIQERTGALLTEQKNTEKSKQNLNVKLGNKADSDAISNRVMANAQMINAKSAERVGFANANYLNQLAKSQENVRNMYDAIKFNNIWQGRYNSARTSIEKQNLKIIKSKITYHEKLGEFNEVRAWIGIFNEFTNALYGGGRALEQIMSPFTTADEAANMFGVSGNSTFGMPGTTNGYSGTFIF